MIKGFLEINIPFLVDIAKLKDLIASVDGMSEWAFSRHHLEQALKQQEEKIDAMYYSLNSIKDALTVVRDQSRNYELMTQTKLEEISADKENFGHKFFSGETIEFGDSVERFLGTLAILMAIVSLTVDMGVAVFGVAFNDLLASIKDAQFIPAFIDLVILIMLIPVFLAILYIVLRLFRFISRKRLLTKFVSWFMPEADPLNLGNSSERDVVVLEQRFENSALRLKLIANNYDEICEDMGKVNSRMPSIVNPKSTGIKIKSNLYMGYETSIILG